MSPPPPRPLCAAAAHGPIIAPRLAPTACSIHRLERYGAGSQTRNGHDTRTFVPPISPLRTLISFTSRWTTASPSTRALRSCGSTMTWGGGGGWDRSEGGLQGRWPGATRIQMSVALCTTSGGAPHSCDSKRPGAADARPRGMHQRGVAAGVRDRAEVPDAGSRPIISSLWRDTGEILARYWLDTG